MSQLRKCDICGMMIEHESQLPDHWTNLSMFSLDGNQMNCNQIDICNTCRSNLAEFYECLESGTFVINPDFYSKSRVAKEVLRFILGLDNREKS